jgi:hypothetical protein
LISRIAQGARSAVLSYTIALFLTCARRRGAGNARHQRAEKMLRTTKKR